MDTTENVDDTFHTTFANLYVHACKQAYPIRNTKGILRKFC